MVIFVTDGYFRYRRVGFHRNDPLTVRFHQLDLLSSVTDYYYSFIFTGPTFYRWLDFLFTSRFSHGQHYLTYDNNITHNTQ